VTALDPADLVVIAGRTLGIGTDAALAQMDIGAAQDALAEARPAGQGRGTGLSDRAAAAAAGVGLVRALLRHRPFPEHGEQVAVAAGLQFLSLNGWRADLDPPAAAAVVVEALASGRLASADAAAWLSPRLSPVRRPWGQAHSAGRAARLRRPVSLPPVRVPAGRAVAGAVLAIAVSGVTLLAAACSRAPAAPAVPSGGTATVRQSTGTAPTEPADSAYAACLRSHGITSVTELSARGVAVIAPAAGTDQNSLKYRSATDVCRLAARPLP
jgi:prophage maintenance system killer protein